MDLFGFDPPEIADDEMADIARRHWGIGGAATPLRGERSANAHLVADDGTEYLLQVKSATERPDVTDLETKALLHLAERDPGLPVARVVPTSDGAPLAEVERHGDTHLGRMVTFLPGTTFEPDELLPESSYEAIGDVLGRLAAGLADFEHPAAQHFMPWDIANGLIVDDGLRAHLGAGREVIERVDERLHAVSATMSTLPRATIHNDGHAGNLVRPGTTSVRVTGVIDFGDLVHTVAGADVAIAAESFAPDHPEPTATLAAIAAGYHGRSPLCDAEIAALPELVLARAALSVLLLEYMLRHVPNVAAGANHALDGVIDRLDRWNALDPVGMAEQVARRLEARP
jgi:hydroxylysine kinase